MILAAFGSLYNVTGSSVLVIVRVRDLLPYFIIIIIIIIIVIIIIVITIIINIIFVTFIIVRIFEQEQFTVLMR